MGSSVYYTRLSFPTALLLLLDCFNGSVSARVLLLIKGRAKSGGGTVDDTESLPSAATTAALSAFASSSSSSVGESTAPTASALTSKDFGAMLPSEMEDDLPHANSAANTAGSVTDDPASSLNDGKDPMNALWNFEGHTLRELQPAAKNPQHSQQKEREDGAAPSAAAKEVDDDGHPILYGSCGRDKRYARCSVCYFRGLRCNSAHYCGCCQRPVCIRPRKYPGEEHPKICWNVLHMDKDMVHRVEKKKRRRLQAAGGSDCRGSSSGGGVPTGGASPQSIGEDAPPGPTPPAKEIANI